MELDHLPAQCEPMTAAGVPDVSPAVPPLPRPPAPSAPDAMHLTRSRALIVTILETLTQALNSMCTGLITVGLPRMAQDLHLEEGLLLWPQSVNGLTCGSCLLVAGSVADVVGGRWVNLTGILLNGVFAMACGASKTGIQLILFRAIVGIANALVLPTSVSILSTAVPAGKMRNVAFSCLGLGQVLGFSLGLVLSGAFIETIGWQFGFYLFGALEIAVFAVAIWALPAYEAGVAGSPRIGSGTSRMLRAMLRRLKREVDWIGAGIASCCLALLSYVLAMITSDVNNLRRPSIISMLTTSVVLIPAFIYWMGHQEHHHKPALIPNSLWRNRPFVCVCLMELFVYAELQTMELFASLFFQQVQQLSALQTSLRILPSLAVGAILELSTGLFIHRMSVLYLTLGSCLLSIGSPILMALINPAWPYWYDAFPAQLLTPFAVDVLFTVGILIISDVFPTRMQSLAGAVFNTVTQFGASLGLAVMGIISTSVSQRSAYSDKKSPQALEQGYRATFWAAAAWMGTCCFLGFWGLRSMGRIGVKRD